MGARYGAREKGEKEREKEREGYRDVENKELPRASERTNEPTAVALSPLLDLAFRFIGLRKINGNSHDAACRGWEENRDTINAPVNDPAREGLPRGVSFSVIIENHIVRKE